MAFTALASAALPSLIGAATSAFGAKDQMSQASQMAAQADYAAKAYKTSLVDGPSWEMSGLKKAGINPLLRYGTGGTSTPTYSANVSSTPINKLEGAAGYLADAGTSAASTLKTMEETKKVQEETNKLGEEIKNLGTNRRLTEAQINSEQQRMWQLFGQRLLQTSQVELNSAQTAQLQAMLKQIDAQTGFLNVQARLYEKGATLSDIVVDIVQAIQKGGDNLSDLPVVPNKTFNELLGWSLF